MIDINGDGLPDKYLRKAASCSIELTLAAATNSFGNRRRDCRCYRFQHQPFKNIGGDGSGSSYVGFLVFNATLTALLQKFISAI